MPACSSLQRLGTGGCRSSKPRCIRHSRSRSLSPCLNALSSMPSAHQTERGTMTSASSPADDLSSTPPTYHPKSRGVRSASAAPSSARVVKTARLVKLVRTLSRTPLKRPSKMPPSTLCSPRCVKGTPNSHASGSSSAHSAG
eukprot:scaffold101902_cov69-Phaeocystis_antarctica.AAC.1